MRNVQSVLPRIPGKRTASGFRVVVDRTGRGELLGWSCLVVLFLFLLYLVVSDLVGPRRAIGKDLAALGAASGVAAGFYQMLVRRRFRHGALHVAPWPIRLGSTVTAELQAFVKGQDAAPSARLECIEEAIRAKGTRYQERRTATVYECSLPPATMRWSGTRLHAAWTLDIPAECPPSFQMRDRQVQWRVVTSIPTAGGETTAEFELLVIPEIAE